jgi:hypothetical protein
MRYPFTIIVLVFQQMIWSIEILSMLIPDLGIEISLGKDGAGSHFY